MAEKEKLTLKEWLTTIFVLSCFLFFAYAGNGGSFDGIFSVVVVIIVALILIKMNRNRE